MIVSAERETGCGGLGAVRNASELHADGGAGQIQVREISTGWRVSCMLQGQACSLGIMAVRASDRLLSHPWHWKTIRPLL